MISKRPPPQAQQPVYPRNATRKPRRRLSFAMVTGIAFGVIWLGLWLFLDHRPRNENQWKCATNLEQIAHAISRYSNDFKGRYPDSFGDLLVAENMSASVFICPDSNDTAAHGPTLQAMAANLRVGGHCSYIYLGKGLTAQTLTNDIVIAYEPMVNHGDGLRVLLGNGDIEFLDTEQAQPLLKQISAGMWPVVLRTTSATQPGNSP